MSLGNRSASANAASWIGFSVLLLLTGRLSALEPAASPAATPEGDTQKKATPPTQTNEVAFEVTTYRIRGNSLLEMSVLERIFTNAMGTNVTFERIKSAVTELQTAYWDRGYLTVRVTLPQQQLTNAAVQLLVTEGRLAEITVANNTYFSSNNVRRALPSLREGIVLNSHVFQRELDAANANRDRQIYPVIGPGPEPGTSALTLKVKDHLPFHGRFELNNQSTPGTPDLRMNLAGTYNNLWQLEHQLGLQYSFTPEGLKSGEDYNRVFFDEPVIANYSAYYRLPLGKPKSIQAQVDARPLDFGYGEVNHQFRLPPATGRPEVTVYASRSTSDTGIQLAPRTLITQSPLLTIFSEDSGQDLTLNENLGAALSIPLVESDKFRAVLTAGLDFKRYQLTSNNTNNFIILTVITNQFGSQTNESVVASPQPTRHEAVDYLPINLGLDLSIPDKFGSTAISLRGNYNLSDGGAFSSDANFSSAAYSTNARAGYTSMTLGMTRDQRIVHDWSLLLRANGQWANGPLISNEQFGLGGTAGVRGYREGEEYGDSGWRVLFEPRTPLINLGMVDLVVPFWVRASAFVDYGELYLKAPSTGAKGTVRMLGAGFGFTANVGSSLDARLTVACPLMNTAQTSAGSVRIYFGIGAQF